LPCEAVCYNHKFNKTIVAPMRLIVVLALLLVAASAMNLQRMHKRAKAVPVQSFVEEDVEDDSEEDAEDDVEAESEAELEARLGMSLDTVIVRGGNVANAGLCNFNNCADNDSDPVARCSVQCKDGETDYKKVLKGLGNEFTGVCTTTLRKCPKCNLIADPTGSNANHCSLGSASNRGDVARAFGNIFARG